YKVFSVNKVDRTLVRTLEVLRNPANAKRVRSFHLDPAALRDLSRAEAIVNEHHRPPQQHGALATFTTQLFQSLPGLSTSKSPQAGDPISAAKITEDLETVLPSLRNVDNFSFTWEMVSAFTEPYLPLAWRSLGTNLQYLRLNLHPRSVSSQLPHDINFPCLRSLHFSFTIADDPRDLLLPVGESISRFINKFEYTLESLYIGSPQRRDLRNMYASLTRFKKLQSFEISPHTFASPESLITFLSNHSDTLTSLTYVSDSNPLFVNGLSNLELHHLEKLVMRLHYVPYPKAWWNVPSPFFNSISSTLRILTIEGAVTITELDQVLNALVGENPKDAALEEFSVAVSSLSVEVLALLAKRVPSLKSLDLRIHDVVAKGGFPITPSEFFPFTSSPPHPRQTTPGDFIQSGREVLLPLQWILADITIKRRSCCGDLVQWGLMKFLAQCIPTIRSFARRCTLAIPDPPNAKPEGKICPLEVHCPFWAGPQEPPRDYSP
ncbi:hypothetical protein FA13DRAFT_1732155, partial [Coprinellus micaceus]